MEFLLGIVVAIVGWIWLFIPKSDNVEIEDEIEERRRIK